jgi:hypothetical protein
MNTCMATVKARARARAQAPIPKKLEDAAEAWGSWTLLNAPGQGYSLGPLVARAS